MKEMYGDQFGEFVCGYWGLKGQTLTIYVTDIDYRCLCSMWVVGQVCDPLSVLLHAG